MSDKNKTDSAASKKTAEERKARMEKRAAAKKVLDRAKRIKAFRKAEEAKIAAEERNARIARRLEERRKIEETKKRIMEAKKAAEAAKGKSGEETKPQEPVVEFVDFAVTARKYKTQLTRKYKERKFWVDPSPYEIVSFIPGTIISIDVKENRVVKEGTQLLILEAMKMQNRVDMPFTARIKKINVKVGEKVPKDFVMIELEPAD